MTPKREREKAEKPYKGEKREVSHDRKLCEQTRHCTAGHNGDEGALSAAAAAEAEATAAATAVRERGDSFGITSEDERTLQVEA